MGQSGLLLVQRAVTKGTIPTLRTAQFEFTLPPAQIAQQPVSPRDHSRLMIVKRDASPAEHARFYHLGHYLRSGDVLVLNVTRVFPARLRGHKSTGGKVDLLMLRQETPERWVALVRGAAAIGAELIFREGLRARLESRLNNGEAVLVFSQPDVRAYLDRYGEMPLPPYIDRADVRPEDKDRYQTVFAREEGSIAAPTAGFHFTPELLASLRQRGIETAEIVLHVGWGTFRPIRAEAIEDHTMLPETFAVSETTSRTLNRARSEGRRVIAVGTTAVRTLESIYDSKSGYRAGSGSTNVFIYPGYTFRAIDALITNFHLPHSTPLLLACAFFGMRGDDPFTLRPFYAEAMREGYRFYSYGDAMLIQ